MGRHEKKRPNTRWHTLFGALLDSVLTPVGVQVLVDVPVMTTPPEADIVLLRRDGPMWTPEQQAFLPDGIRDSRAGHVILEFKYTQSLSDQALRQAVGYEYFYRESHGLTTHNVLVTVVSARTPHRGTLRRFGYTTVLKPGVYQSTAPLLDRILVLVSNQLEDTVYNAPVKCFASRKAEQQRAFALLQQYRGTRFSQRFWWLLNGLVGYFFVKRRDAMQIELTPEYITELGKIWGDAFLANIPVEQRLAGLKPEDVVRNYRVEDILAGLKPEERLAGLKPEDIKRYLQKITTS